MNAVRMKRGVLSFITVMLVLFIARYSLAQESATTSLTVSKQAGLATVNEVSIERTSQECPNLVSASLAHEKSPKQKTPELVVQRGHAGQVSAYSVSRGGGIIASASTEGSIKIWEAENHQLLRSISAGPYGLTSIAISPNSEHIAVGSADGGISIWNAFSGKLVKTLKIHSLPITALTFSLDGKLLASGSNQGTGNQRSPGIVAVWEVCSTLDTPIWQNSNQVVQIRRLRFTEDGGILAAIYKSRYQLWDVANGEELSNGKLFNHELHDIVLSLDGEILAAIGFQKDVYQTMENVSPLAGGKKLSDTTINAKYLTGYKDSQGRRWEVGRGIASVIYPVMRVWSQAGEKPREIDLFPDHKIGFRRFVGGFWQDELLILFQAGQGKSKRLVTAGGGKIAEWNITTGDKICAVEHDGQQPVATVLGRDRFRIVYVDGVRYDQMRDLLVSDLDDKCNKRQKRITGIATPPATVSLFTKDNEHLIVSTDTATSVWDLRLGRMNHYLGNEPTSPLGFSDSSNSIMTLSHSDSSAAGMESKLVEWDWINDAMVHEWVFQSYGQPLVFDKKLIMGSKTYPKGVTAPPKPPGFLSLSVGGEEIQKQRRLDISAVTFFGGADTIAFGGKIENGKGFVSNLNLRTAVESLTEIHDYPSVMQYSPVGDRFVLGTTSGELFFFDVSDGVIDSDSKIEIKNGDGAVTALRFTLDGKTLIAGDGRGYIRIYNSHTAELKEANKVYELPVSSIAVTQDKDLIASGGADNSIHLISLSTLEILKKLEGHALWISSLEFTKDGHLLSSTEDGGITKLWDIPTGDLIGTLVSNNAGQWVFVSPSNRFDTSDLEEIQSVNWVMPDDPMQALPLEIFMRDYYEPRLLSRLLAGEQFPEIRALAELNRAQPKVAIVGIERETGAGASGDTVTVTVDVAGASEEFGLEGSKRRMQTGLYDLRLFRDGQLVGQWPEPGGATAEMSSDAEAELLQWRKERLVVQLKEGKRQIVFKGIRLPRRAGLDEVQFSAYAFNEDRVKSETARQSFDIPTNLTPRTPRAYIVSVGVNAFEDSGWDLSYAANDAKQLGEALKKRLQAQRDEGEKKRYEQVVWVKLTSEWEIDGQGERRISKAQASKAQIRAVLKTLAGQAVEADALKGIEGAEQLRRANPEDLVIIAFSSHGEVDERGQFYLLPQDIGVDPSEQQRRQRAVSNDELSDWLRGLDAIDLVMIVDACHSAASVQSEEFKPGPMGSRGLGQLAYDKGMRILAATQIDQYALETPKTQLGLLSYALVREGLERDKADYKPHDQAIWLSEWMSYASDRVPGLYQDWREGKLKGTKRGEILAAPEALPGETPSLQQPALFDFARERDVMISREIQ